MNTRTTCGPWKTQSYLGTFRHYPTLPGRLKSLTGTCDFNLSCDLGIPKEYHGISREVTTVATNSPIVLDVSVAAFKASLDTIQTLSAAASAGFSMWGTSFFPLYLLTHRKTRAWVQADVWPQNGFSSSELQGQLATRPFLL